MAKQKINAAKIRENIASLKTAEKLLSDLDTAIKTEGVPESIKVTLKATREANASLLTENVSRVIRQMLPKMDDPKVSDVEKLWKVMESYWTEAK